MDETLKTLAVRAHAKGLELAGRVAPGVPDALVGDPGRLRQVLVNLVGNAIKFTEQGEVVVSVGPMPEDPRRRRVWACTSPIRDTGIGIPAEKQRRDLRAVRAGRRLDDAQVRRDRPGPGHLRQAGRR